jgi:hypothetical protein
MQPHYGSGALILILNYNGAEETIPCVRSLLSDPEIDIEQIIVIDNASTDDSVATIKESFPGIAVFRNDKNLGFAEGYNRAILEFLGTGRNCFFILNNDTLVRPGTMSALLETLSGEKDVGIVGPAVLNMNTTVIHSVGFSIDFSRGRTVCHSNGLDYEFLELAERDVECVCGCAMLISRDVFERTGLFPSHFGFFSEEADLCLRARKQGFRIRCNPKGIVEHKSGSTTARFPEVRARLSIRNQLLLTKRHGTIVQLVSYSIWLFVLEIPFLSIKDCGQHRKLSMTISRLMGAIDGLRMLTREPRL